MATALGTQEFTTAWFVNAHKRRLTLLTVLTVIVCLLLARLVLLWDLLSLSGLVVTITVIAIVIQPRYGLYVLFALILIFEAGRGMDPLMEPGRYLNTSLQDSMGL